MKQLSDKNIAPLREGIEWVNFWWDNGHILNCEDRILLVGASQARFYRHLLAATINQPVDLFATSACLTDEMYYKQLELFLSFAEYREEKIQLHIGVHNINNFLDAKERCSLEQFEELVDKLITLLQQRVSPKIILATTTLARAMNEAETFVPYVNEEIQKENAVVRKIARDRGLLLNDLEEYMDHGEVKFEHTDFAHFDHAGNDFIARRTAEFMDML